MQKRSTIHKRRWNDAVSFSASDSKLVITSSGNNRAGPTTTTPHLSQGQKFEAKVVTRSGSAQTCQLLYYSYGNTYENIPYASNVYEVWIGQNHVGTERYDCGAGSGEDVISYPYIEYRTTDYVHFGTREKGEIYNENSVWDNTDFKLAFYTYSAGTIAIDLVFIRKYALPEPGATIGSEESSSDPSTATSSTGTFDLQNSAPAVTDFTLYDAAETDTITEMTPQIEYALEIELYDANTMTDISQIDVTLKTHGTSTSGPDSVTDKATYRWTPSAGWVFVGPAGSTWDINVSACVQQPAAMASTTGTWWLHFTPGTVARESNWDIYVEVTDTQSTTADKLKELYVTTSDSALLKSEASTGCMWFYIAYWVFWSLSIGRGTEKVYGLWEAPNMKTQW